MCTVGVICFRVGNIKVTCGLGKQFLLQQVHHFLCIYICHIIYRMKVMNMFHSFYTVTFINLTFLLQCCWCMLMQSQHSFDTIAHVVCSRRLLGEASSYSHPPDTMYTHFLLGFTVWKACKHICQKTELSNVWTSLKAPGEFENCSSLQLHENSASFVSASRFWTCSLSENQSEESSLHQLQVDKLKLHFYGSWISSEMISDAFAWKHCGAELLTVGFKCKFSVSSTVHFLHRWMKPSTIHCFEY